MCFDMKTESLKQIVLTSFVISFEGKTRFYYTLCDHVIIFVEFEAVPYIEV